MHLLGLWAGNIPSFISVSQLSRRGYYSGKLSAIPCSGEVVEITRMKEKYNLHLLTCDPVPATKLHGLKMVMGGFFELMFMD